MFKSQLEAIQEAPDDIVDCIYQYVQHYKTNHYLMAAGADFSFQFARVNFEFLEAAMKILDGRKTSTGQILKFHFSTVDEYFKAIFIEQ